MWRNLSRRLQQSFKRTICVENSDNCVEDVKNRPTCVNKVQHSHCYITQLIPCIFQHSNQCYSKQKNSNHQKDHNEKDSKNISHHTYLEAFGWSGALVFGWLISKQLWLKYKWTQDHDKYGKNVCNQYLIDLFSQKVKTQPPGSYILPLPNQKPTPPSTTQPTNHEESTCNHKESTCDLEEEFEAAGNELLEVHEKAIGEALNRRGIACLSRSTAAEAISLFKRASQFKYAPASFNMGQCYELGIGTEQDFKQAAEWYHKAADQGHATAMYNLGVFYAHGWGGLNADVDTAKSFFKRAAKLGQPDAKAALAIEADYSSNFNSNTNNNEISFKKDITTETAHLKSSDLDLFMFGIRSGLKNDIIQRGYESEKNWDMPLNNTVAV